MTPLLLIGTLLAQLASTSASGDCVDDSHPSGRFITCFDPGRGLELGVGGSALSLTPGVDFTASVRWRGQRDSKSKAGTTWLLAHRFARVDGRVGPDARHLSLAAYEGIARRHVDEGSLLLPTNPPVRLPFPIDLGLYGRLARWERRVEEGNGWVFETARIAMLFDPVRSGSARFHFGIGPVASHAMRHDGLQLMHELTPLTALQVVMNAESEDGLWAFRLNGFAGWTFDPTVIKAGGTLRVRGEATLERVLVAVNDQPISVQLNASGAFRDAGSLAKNEWAVGGALKVQLFAHR